ncbi:MAG: elongation factor P [Phycisphaerales bacterium]
MKATDIRPGYGIKVDGKLCVATQVDHRTPGNLRAFMQIKYKEVLTGKVLEKRWSSGDEIEVFTLDKRDMEYLYSDNTGATFMDKDNFDQVTIPEDTFADSLKYLAPNASAVILFYENNPVSMELPAAVELVITECPPGVKNATATNQLKDATCETGLKTRVPAFINEGEKIKISTADGSYISRA